MAGYEAAWFWERAMTKAERLVYAAAFAMSESPVAAANEVRSLRLAIREWPALSAEDADLLREFIDDPKPGPAACPACGALARKDGKCMGCDRVLQDA